MKEFKYSYFDDIMKIDDLFSNLQTIEEVDIFDRNPSIKEPLHFKKVINLKKLSLVTNNKETIERLLADLHNLKNLEELTISTNVAVNVFSFSILNSKLKYLDLGMENLKKIEGKSEHLKELQILKIDSEKLEKLPDVLFSQLHNLIELNLNFPKLDKLPLSINTLYKLKTLRLDNYAYTIKFSKEFIKLSTIESIWLKPKEKIGREVYREEYLEIPKNIEYLKNLKNLSLYYLRVKNIEKILCSVVNLEMLNISNTNLDYVPKALKSKELKVLGLTNNKIKEIPNWIFQNKNLEALLLNKNPITKISIKNINVPSLKSFNIRETNLSINDKEKLEHHFDYLGDYLFL